MNDSFNVSRNTSHIILKFKNVLMKGVGCFNGRDDICFNNLIGVKNYL